MLIDEIEQIQNSGLGATLIWRFACTYIEQRTDKDVPLAYAFLVIPLLYNKVIFDIISSTTKGLRKVEEKFSDDHSLASNAQDMALSMRSLSQSALGIALRTGLVTLSIDGASYRPRSFTSPTSDDKGTRRILRAAEKLGQWASEVSLREFCYVFHLEL